MSDVRFKACTCLEEQTGYWLTICKICNGIKLIEPPKYVWTIQTVSK